MPDDTFDDSAGTAVIPELLFENYRRANCLDTLDTGQGKIRKCKIQYPVIQNGSRAWAAKFIPFIRIESVPCEIVEKFESLLPAAHIFRVWISVI